MHAWASRLHLRLRRLRFVGGVRICSGVGEHVVFLEQLHIRWETLTALSGSHCVVAAIKEIRRKQSAIVAKPAAQKAGCQCIKAVLTPGRGVPAAVALLCQYNEAATIDL